MQKSFFVRIGGCALALIVLFVSLYAWFMTGGTRLLYENSTLGQIWRLYPWGLLATVALAIAGCICMVKGYVKKADRKPKMRPVMMGGMPPYAAPEGMQQPAAEPQANAGRVCPSCGTVNEVNVPYCIRCGCMLLCEQPTQNVVQDEPPVQE